MTDTMPDEREELARIIYSKIALNGGDDEHYESVREGMYHDAADAVSEWMLKQEAKLIHWLADDLLKNGPALNYELNHDGTEDPLKAAYVEGQHDAWDRINFRANEADRACGSSSTGGTDD